MNELARLFDAVPLPYKLITMPTENDPPTPRTDSYGAFMNKRMRDVYVDVLENSGFRFFVGAGPANVVTGSKMPAEDLMSYKTWCRVCHHFGVELIGTKSELHMRMKELAKRLGHPVPYYPLAFYPPEDYEELLEAWHTVPIWIIKAPALSRARCLRLVRPEDEPAPKLPYVVEQYIPRPYLITGRKFDIRLYALVTNSFPFTLYYHENGLGLFATTPYDEEGDLTDLTKHITNFEINKESPSFVTCEGINEKIEDSKWSLPFLLKYFESQGVDSKKLRKEIEDVATSAIITCMCAVRDSHRKHVTRHRRCSFELLGVDILVDQDLKPWLLEINVSPGMHGSSELDVHVKSQVLYDLFNIIRMLDFVQEDQSPCKAYVRVERLVTKSLTEERREAVVSGKVKVWDNPVFADYMIIREFVDEQMRRRRFHRAFPKRKDMDTFAPCFNHLEYEDIVLQEFVRMSNEERMNVLMENLDVVYFAFNPEQAKVPDDKCSVA